jgi:SHS2 domain-containing protein
VTPFEEIDHTADWAFRVCAPSREELFSEAAEALYSLSGIQTGPAAAKTKSLSLQAGDLESLFILWLNELLYLADQERVALRDIRIERLTDTELKASGRAEEIAAVGKYIKAATYGGLRISEEDGIWKAAVVVDV